MQSIRSDLVGFGRIWSDLVGFGRIRSDLVGFGRIRSDLVGFGRIRSDLVGFGRIWSDLVGFRFLVNSGNSIKMCFRGKRRYVSRSGSLVVKADPCILRTIRLVFSSFVPL